MSFPLPPSPITWTPEEAITSTRLRADPANLAWLLTQRPLLLASQQSTGQAIPPSTQTPVTLDTEYVDNWNGHSIGAATYTAQLPGWYLCEGSTEMVYNNQAHNVAAGIQPTQSSVTTSHYGGVGISNGTNDVGMTCSDLVELNSLTLDTVALFAFQSDPGTPLLDTPGAYFKAEWVAMPTSGLGVITGTVVTNPQPAALWAPGSGTTVTNGGGIAAGATSVTVGEATGMVVGGTLGLDYYQGTPVQDYAEAVTITSVAGTTIGISATVYPHALNAPVSIPVSAAFMNQQVRDVINFLAYPPIARLIYTAGSQSLATQTFPAGTAITWTSATVDNFTGWNASAKSQYVFPVSGVYYVYGQVSLASCVTNLAAGLAISGGTILWGTSTRTNGTAQSICATVVRTLRVTAGQYVQLFGSQSSGSTQAINGAGSNYCSMHIVFRGF